MQTEMILRSSDLLYAANLIRWLRNMHYTDARRAVLVLKATWGVTDAQAHMILTDPAKCRVDHETGDVYVTITVNAKQASY